MTSNTSPSQAGTETAATSSRRSLLGKAALTGLAAAPLAGMLSSPAKAATLQTLDESAKEFFRDILSHEIDHAARLRQMLGGKARPKPTFKNLATTSLTDFVTKSRMLENTCVGALLGALPLISSTEVRAVAGQFALIEGRHAGYVNVFAGLDVSTQSKTNAPSAFDKPLTIAEVLARANPFIASLNGGPAATFTPGNDIEIMNFALIFEDLGVAFYGLNNPKYVASTPATQPSTQPSTQPV